LASTFAYSRRFPREKWSLAVPFPENGFPFHSSRAVSLFPLMADTLSEILKKVRKIELITRGIVKAAVGGEYHSVFKGQGIDFDDFREYAPGDEVRSIDWNVTARMGFPFIKKFVEERELTVFLAVDVSASKNFG